MRERADQPLTGSKDYPAAFRPVFSSQSHSPSNPEALDCLRSTFKFFPGLMSNQKGKGKGRSWERGPHGRPGKKANLLLVPSPQSALQ